MAHQQTTTFDHINVLIDQTNTHVTSSSSSSSTSLSPSEPFLKRHAKRPIWIVDSILIEYRLEPLLIIVPFIINIIIFFCFFNNQLKPIEANRLVVTPKYWPFEISVEGDNIVHLCEVCLEELSMHFMFGHPTIDSIWVKHGTCRSIILTKLLF